jgi:hypothetical protein
MKILILLLLFAQEKVEFPQIVRAQIIMDPVQARYPGNEHVKQCGPQNHDNACFDPNLHHHNAHLYTNLNTCQKWEKVECTEVALGWWIPVGKVVIDEVSTK